MRLLCSVPVVVRHAIYAQQRRAVRSPRDGQVGRESVLVRHPDRGLERPDLQHRGLRVCARQPREGLSCPAGPIACAHLDRRCSGLGGRGREVAVEMGGELWTGEGQDEGLGFAGEQAADTKTNCMPRPDLRDVTGPFCGQKPREIGVDEIVPLGPVGDCCCATTCSGLYARPQSSVLQLL